MNKQWLDEPSADLDEKAKGEAEVRQLILTKPPGALGDLEQLAIRIAAMQGNSQPNIGSVSISVFAADHGIASSGVSAFPQSVTTEMLRNFSTGGAAICVLAKSLDATLEVINLGTINDPGPLDNVIEERLGDSTADFTQQAAMSNDQLYQALNIGRQAAERASHSGADLFIGGDMGIGNTTSASAIACALLIKNPNLLVGPGTGLNNEGIQHKVSVINNALAKHNLPGNQPLEILRCFGGFEIAALVGSYVTCSQIGRPVLVDGFICSVAALVANALCANASQWFIFSHTSAEPGHRYVLEALNAKPLLNLGMRLGEGSGAAVAVPLLRLACDLHNNMATFSEAGVSEKNV